jgi:hypothetical protein
MASRGPVRSPLPSRSTVIIAVIGQNPCSNSNPNRDSADPA